LLAVPLLSNAAAATAKQPQPLCQQAAQVKANHLAPHLQPVMEALQHLVANLLEVAALWRHTHTHRC
jgi:hypothetical protein